jgi:hypothetical protein
MQAGVDRVTVQQYRLVLLLDKIARITQQDQAQPGAGAQRLGPVAVELAATRADLERQAGGLRRQLRCEGMRHGDDQYKRVCAAAKKQHIAQSEAQLTTSIVGINAANLALRRATASGDRAAKAKAQGQRKRCIDKARKHIGSLTAWHAADGDTQCCYHWPTVRTLVTVWLDKGCTDQLSEQLALPWQPASIPLRPQLVAEQRYLRCIEERDILLRETADMCTW